jgi:adenylate cyclase
MKFLHQDRSGQGDDGLPALKLWSLRFLDEDWDDRYRAAIREGNLAALRFAMMIALGLNSAFIPQDLFFYPENATAIALWRGIGINGLFAALLVASYRPYWRTRWPGLLMLMVIGYTVFQSLANVYGGHHQPVDAGFILMIFIIYSLLPFFYIQAVNAALISTTIFLGLTIWLGWPHERPEQVFYTTVVILSSNLIGFVALRRMELLRRRGFASGELVAEERARVRELLDRILPASVAEKLRGGETQVVEKLADVTVLFADVEGFTDMAAHCEPEETLDVLSTTFERFDRLVAEHGVEKIKTIGDAYMVAAGAPAGSPADARNMAELALAMTRAVSDMTRPDGKPLHVRIGIARGPIVAGVVGDSRFLYDLWGDAVNTASRMEMTGEPERIQCTADVVEALEGKYAFEPRGEVEIKGKGMMPTWWLTGPVAQAAE